MIIDAFREIEDICIEYRVDMKSPDNIDEFLKHVHDFEKMKQKGSHLLFNEIELEVREKNKFLKQQCAGIDNMVVSYRNLLGRINVLKSAVRLLRLSDS